ncbi:MAG: rhomboid family intramembrane serine protease [Parachlamydiales bacterium]|jgi:GlpG protein
MRLIKSFETEEAAQKFSLFLQERGIRNFLDLDQTEKALVSRFQVWVFDEDSCLEARKLFLVFEAEGTRPNLENRFAKAACEEKPSQAALRKKFLKMHWPSRRHSLTVVILGLCSLLYLINYHQELKLLKKAPKQSFVVLTPILSWTLFDLPYALIEYDLLIKKYDLNPANKSSFRNPAFLADVKKLENLPYWQGLDELLKRKLKKAPLELEAPLFEKIRQGQVWRLFSPAFMHKDFLHLLFNMLWVWILGRPIEERLKKWRYLALVLILALAGNVLQYLASGPNFLGYSGVVMGMVGFIWMRQKIAPWEGYSLQKSTYIFLASYVLLMLGISLTVFFFDLFGQNIFAVNIANTAHIAGAFLGAFLGRLNFFMEKTHE